ncbi:centrosomal protein of 192 kDa isoform X3 [Belonocnema kinseyi]|uniref:centrosomal protein of 192 kDa isoform X3 n=1 Tax=Belonocnema kinseyi TaxID=2817044 RepID=UPI00143DA36F|nr:centrosomal protein of 192 kDa isoform X3 [Belonocnema kinseyi]
MKKVPIGVKMEEKARKKPSSATQNDRPDFTDITVFGTPLPQATSTVERKSTLPPRYSQNAFNTDHYKRQLMNDSNATHDSSLGILHNISTYGNKKQPGQRKDIDTERELARRLLQRCSAPLLKDEKKADKENDGNVQNMIGGTTRSSLMGSEQSSAQSFTAVNEEENFSTENNAKSFTSNSVVFEPREITARSSEMSKNSENPFPNSFQANLGGLSFNSTAAELMAQFGGEEFKSDSRMINQMMEDEISWRQNYPFAMPLPPNTGEKERLDLSCFSGIIGDFDLSLESCGGRKVSIGEFFKRKCENIGELSSSDSVQRPSFGFSIKSPKKREKMEPLIDITGMTDESTVHKEKENKRLSSTIDLTKENSLMSLSSIAQVLQNIDDGTPRKLVDQLIMAKMKKKQPQTQQVVSDTYTLLPSSRSSLPVSHSNTLETEKTENETLVSEHTLRNRISKYSLDSRTLGNTPIKNHSLKQNLSPKAEKDLTPKADVYGSTISEQTKVKENKCELSFPESKPALGTSSLPQFNSPIEGPKSAIRKYEDMQAVYIKKGSPVSVQYSDEESNFIDKDSPKMPQPEKLEKEDSPLSQNSVCSPNLHLSLQGSVTIGKKTQELCMCVVGIRKETDLDISNKGDRWIICSVSLNQIQGDSEAIELLLPSDVVLVEPDGCKTLRIEVRILKMTTPILAVLNIVTSDFVTRSRWNSKYIICFISEDLQVDVTTPSKEMEINFESITEDGSKRLPITFENKNCVDLPILLSISQDEPATYRIQKTVEETEADGTDSKLTYFLLKSRERCTVNVEFKGVPLNLFQGPDSENSLRRVSGKLTIQTEPNSKDDPGIIIKEIPFIGYIGFCKIRTVDSKLPILIPKMQNKLLTLQNSGNIGVQLSAKIVEKEGEEIDKSCEDFVITPESLFLQGGEKCTFAISYMPQHFADSERHAVVKIRAGTSKYCYPVIGEREFTPEETCDSFRCETPQLLRSANSPYNRSVASPTSPYNRSVASPNSPYNRSPNSGRDSPGGSSVSGSTIAGDVIPIRATHSSLAWSSIRVGKLDAKEITIRNTSNNKIKLHTFIMSKDQYFKFARDQQKSTNSLILTLQATESKTITVIFNPLSPGAVTGKLLFQHYSHTKDHSESRSPKVIPLYGYGGSTKLEISKAYKDTGGQMWLSLGKMTGGSLDAKIKLENLGDLTCYVKLKLIPKAVYPSMAFSWCVEPTELLLGPNEGQWVSLEFRPRKEDLQLLSKSTVSHVGTLNLTYGDEPTRLRIRRLFNKMKESAQQSRKENEFWNVIYPICKAFPGETFIRDITLVRDSNINLGDLCRGVHQQELKLTVETSADETMSILQDDMDDTQTFYSLCSDSCNDISVTGDSYLPAESVLESGHQQYARENEEAFIVRPSSITLVPSVNNEAAILISTSCKVAQPFETVLSNDQEYLTVVPSTGMIPTGKNLALKIECRRQIARDFDAVLRIYTANDKRDVTIRVCEKRN